MSEISSDALLVLPLYVCHKKVRAAEIDGISLTGVLHLKDLGFMPMSRPWLDKHNPEVGGYFVVYEDGYQSYSPKKAFEDGYSAFPPKDETAARELDQKIYSPLPASEATVP